ncbi:MAG: hypothetical protein GKR94_32415 [Gammaproteobacteria bacterium]|nr:hypothetical protein [Gammaproteobacteria bacterium]
MKTVLTITLLATTLLPTALLAHGNKNDGHQEKARTIDYSKAEKHVFGQAADPAKAAQTITVDMSDQMRFTPNRIAARRGEIIRIVVRNKGQLLHELVLGTEGTLNEHAELMKKFPGMEHDEPHMAHVAPGKEQIMGWKFTQAGTFSFGCLIPGHYDAGMKGTITVR